MVNQPQRAAIVLPELAWRASPNFSSRHGVAVHLVVVHRPVGTYGPSIEWLRNPKAQASAHVLTEGAGTGADVATQLVAWGDKAWACEAFNAHSDNIEVDDNAWDGTDPHAFEVAARIVAFRCHARGIPPTWTRAPQSTPGVCRHYDLGLAGGGHSDPTQDRSLWELFMALVKLEYDRGGFRAQWGR